MEEQEWDQRKDEFKAKQEARRENQRRAHVFETQRYHESTKDLELRANRYFAETRSDFGRTISFQRAETEHALKMEIHKVKSNLMNSDPPNRRRINPQTNPSCRGSRKLESIVGKPWLAIPSMSDLHDFKNADFPIISQISSKNRFKIKGTPGGGGHQTARF